MRTDRPAARTVEKLESRTVPEGEESFLTLERMSCCTVYEDGSRSAPYRIDCLHRRGIDAVAVLLYDDTGPTLRVGIRRALRPIVIFRRSLPLPVAEEDAGEFVWESVAGSLEPEDRGEEGVRRRVVEEVWEEAGLRIEADQVESLGAGFFPSHGQSSEKIHLRAVRVRETDQEPGAGRGTGPSEEGWTEFLDAEEVLRMCVRGEVEDPKVEVAVRRILDRRGGSERSGKLC